MAERIRRPRGYRSWFVPAVVALAAFAPFIPALGAEFVTWDDNRNFLDNPHYRGLELEQLRWMWTTFHMGHYVPLSWMTLGLDYEVWGMNPFGYHLQNLLLHAANAVVLYAVAERVLRLTNVGALGSTSTRTIAAAVSALLFAVHPLRVESVAWITERRDVLSLLFCLTSVLCYLRHAESTESYTRWYAMAVVAFLCALLSKATSMSLPAVLFILNVYPLRRVGGSSGFLTPVARRVYAELAPFALLAVGAAALSIVALRPPGQLGLLAKFAVSAYSLAFYLWKSIAPTNLAPLYEMPRTVNPAALQYVASAVVVIALTVGAWMVRRRWPGVTTAWFAFLAIILPMLGIVQNGPQIAADRYTYHAAPALAILVGGGVARWRWPSPLVRTLVMALPLAVLAALTWRQTGVWHDSERLWSRVLSVDSTSSIARIAMGDLLISQDRVEEAVHHYGRGVDLDPTYAEGHNNLGVALARLGRGPEAIERYHRAVALNPAYADPHNNLGIALSQQGDHADAIAHYRQAIALDPRHADAEVNLGNALLRLGKAGAALAHYDRAAVIRPGHADTHLNWGVALAQLGRMAEAVQQFQQVLTIQPDHPDARAYLDRAKQLRLSLPSIPPER